MTASNLHNFGNVSANLGTNNLCLWAVILPPDLCASEYLWDDLSAHSYTMMGCSPVCPWGKPMFSFPTSWSFSRRALTLNLLIYGLVCVCAVLSSRKKSEYKFCFMASFLWGLVFFLWGGSWFSVSQSAKHHYQELLHSDERVCRGGVSIVWLSEAKKKKKVVQQLFWRWRWHHL